MIEGSKSLMHQNLDNVLLTTYNATNSLEPKYVILMDVSGVNTQELEYAYNLCSQNVYILHNEESKNLEQLRNNFGNN